MQFFNHCTVVYRKFQGKFLSKVKDAGLVFKIWNKNLTVSSNKKIQKKEKKIQNKKNQNPHYFHNINGKSIIQKIFNPELILDLLASILQFLLIRWAKKDFKLFKWELGG